MVIAAGLVKELRERTGAGMMDCKKALVEVGGDLEQASGKKLLFCHHSGPTCAGRP